VKSLTRPCCNVLLSRLILNLGRRGGNYLDDKTCLLPRKVFVIAVEYYLTGNTRSVSSFI